MITKISSLRLEVAYFSCNHQKMNERKYKEWLIFKCSLHTNHLELEDKFGFLRIYTRLLSRLSGDMLHLVKKCVRYEGLKIEYLHGLI